MEGRKGRNGKDKVVSDDMTALLAADNLIMEATEESPAVNKRQLKAMSDQTKAEAVATNLYQLADIIDKEMLDRKALKNATCVDLNDIDAVMERTKQYFISCADAKHPPSMLTYCTIGLGLTRANISIYCSRHNNATTDFISRVSDLIADSISTGALYGNLDNIMSIFQLKNLHGFADNVRIEAAMPEQAPEIDEDALKAEYMKYAAENGIDITPDSEDK